MAITYFRSGNRLAPWWIRDPLAGPLGRLAGESGLFGSTARWTPAVDVEETGDDLVLTADLPGLTEDTIEIGFENGVLTIRGEMEERTGDGERRYHLRERRYGGFERSFNAAAHSLGGCDHGHLPEGGAPRPRAEGARVEGPHYPDPDDLLRHAPERVRARGTSPGGKPDRSPRGRGMNLGRTTR